MTGSKITDVKLELLKKISVAEFTLDNLPEIENPFRPRGYNLASMVAMKKCIVTGIKTRTVTVLYPVTMTEKNLESVYHWLCENGISEWELLRFYPVGRATKLAELTPSNQEYLKAMRFLRGLHGFTKIFFQHSLRILEGIGNTLTFYPVKPIRAGGSHALYFILHSSRSRQCCNHRLAGLSSSGRHGRWRR